MLWRPLVFLLLMTLRPPGERTLQHDTTLCLPFFGVPVAGKAAMAKLTGWFY